jgi:hypothetical protein
MDQQEQTCVIKSLFLQGKTWKEIRRELTSVLPEEATSIDPVKRWFRHSKDGDLSVADHERPGRPISDISNAIGQSLNDKTFVPARGLVTHLATDSQTIKMVLERDLALRRFARR